jgi:ubiquitin C-terminal hydrolase
MLTITHMSRGTGLTGLSNVGNTCYLNSCLQVLSHTHELYDMLNDPTVSRRIKRTDEGRVVHEWGDLHDIMWSKNGTVVPNRFVTVIQMYARTKQNRDFAGFAQNDVSEFLTFLFDIFDTALARPVKMNVRGEVKNSRDKTAKACYEMMKRMYETNYSEIIRSFHGIQVTQIIGIEGSHANRVLSASPEPHFILTLALPQSPDLRRRITECTIHDCLRHYTQEEVMDGENQWENDATGKREAVKRRTRFWSLPPVLITTIVRTDAYGRKSRALVRVPEDHRLDMSPYVCGYDANNTYELYAVCNHMGGAFGGHYTANVRVGDAWYCFNDTNVSVVKTHDVVTANAYTLFWRKCNST